MGSSSYRYGMHINPYGPRFWLTYMANIGLMVAVSLLFRYADFVQHVGGTEKQLGMITGVGMVGAIASRCLQGVAIDHYGTARVWNLSLALLVSCLLGHFLVGTAHGPFIYVLRILYTVSLAGAFGASITYVSLRAPAGRMGEMIGMLGSSGFIGMAVGPSIGDWVFAEVDPASMASRLFGWSAAAGGFSLACAFCATVGDQTARPQRGSKVPEHNAWEQIRLYHPGWTLLVGFAMGIGIGMPTTFLSAFAAREGIVELGWFWTPYAATAFVVRILTRTLSDRWGTSPTIVVGLVGLSASMVGYLFVSGDRTLILPALLGGVGHAFLFPAVVAEANTGFPPEHRGLATNLILTMFDTGLLVGQPVFGWTVELSRTNGFDGYVVGFGGLSATLLIVAVVYLSRAAR